MISLYGGVYNGQFVDMPRLTTGSRLRVEADGKAAQVYEMGPDGTAYAREWDPLFETLRTVGPLYR